MIGAALYYKLFAGFGVVLCLVLIVGAIGWRNTTEFAAYLSSLHQNQLVPLAELRRTESALYELRVGGLAYGQAGSRRRAAIRADEGRWRNEAYGHFRLYLATELQPEELEVIPAWDQQFPAYLAARERSLSLYDGGQEGAAAAVLDNDAGPAFVAAHAALAKLIAIQEEQGTQIDRDVSALAETSSRVLLGVVVLALTLGLALAAFVSRYVAGLHAASEKRRLEAEGLVAYRREVEKALRDSEARLQRESERLLALHRASAVVAAQTAEPDAALEEVLRSAVSLIGASSGSLYRWNAEDGVLRCVRNFQVSSTHMTGDVRPPSGLAGQAFERGEPVLVNDYANWEFASQTARVGGMRAGMGVPLMRSGKCIGVLILRVYGDDTTQFNDDDVSIAVLFADQAAAALFSADAFEQQRRAALHDALTGLPNRVLLHDRLRKAIDGAHRDHTPVALMLMDLDRFKDINDTLGHDAGDVLLKEVGRRLESTLRGSDTVARLGGDEFAILLPGADAQTATDAATRLLEVVKQPFLHSAHVIDVGASIGIALHPDHGEDAATLLRRADVAMYVAKRSNQGAVIYSPNQDRHSLDRLALVSDLRRGIERNELVLYYQPKVAIKHGDVAGAEALVRWQHPQSGLMAPDQFIPLAEQTGLIEPLSRWVVESALRQCRAWLDAGIDLPVSVNLSMRNLHDPYLPRLLSDLLAASGVRPEYLQLEITESAIMADAARAKGVLSELRSLGLHVSVDDFGAGHASLTYLKQLPLDALKIDKSFVAELAANASDRAIVRSTIELGHELGLTVIAEGVEDQASWETLGLLGCDLAQGYYLSRPLPAAEFERWLHQSARYGQQRAA
jgi:diguanylate cyclase (GGDEF)-like protein